MYRESEIPYFTILFERYQNLYTEIENTILTQRDFSNLIDLDNIRSQFNFFDIKLRLAFAIYEINLSQEYMQQKVGELRLCHLMLYKFNDLWFAYEAFVKLYNNLNTTSIQSKVIWLSLRTNLDYFNQQEIQNAILRANIELNLKFNTSEKRQHLHNYIQYCISEASNSQSNRLNRIIGKINIPDNVDDLEITDWLSLSYAVRNNFVHNGETTVTTPEFDYSEKKDLIIVLYELLVIISLKSTQKMIEDKINEY
ncbi:hypothetical protein IMCC3317_32410 [Kordia antarctica]|uniref:Uncharacterized protein n=1 Tax=Kordia antarctica TaxID=1218801 RepID=A0A7L4ZMB2_9FLAO|nr:hypothetical protein [Kordia antarctica]QHI37858.1 hypothetical protein IMCC3317_32410 [Kordia antarctica]